MHWQRLKKAKTLLEQVPQDTYLKKISLSRTSFPLWHVSQFFTPGAAGAEFTAPMPLLQSVITNTST